MIPQLGMTLTGKVVHAMKPGWGGRTYCGVRIVDIPGESHASSQAELSAVSLRDGVVVNAA